MRKRRFLFVLLLLPCMIFAQGQAKPFNKGNVAINLGYERHIPDASFGVPKGCLEIGYGFTDWCVAGLYAEYGTFENRVGLWSGSLHSYQQHFIFYGAYNKCHPVSLLLPNFYFFDLYSVLRFGLYHSIAVFEEDDINPTDYLLHYNTCEPYLAGGWGVAINPSRYFGFFYERTHNTLTDFYEVSTPSLKHHLYHRFGINVRFGGPKKWQKQ